MDLRVYRVLRVVIIINLLFSASVLVTGIWLSLRPSTQCFHWLEIPIVAVSVPIILVSLVGFYALRRDLEWLLLSYFILMSILTPPLLGISIFGHYATNSGFGDYLPGKAYKEYRLRDYSKWLRNKVADNWNTIQPCVIRRHVCRSLIDAAAASTSADTFYRFPLSSTQSGCCKPSNDCNFTYVAPTNWAKTSNVSTNPDCAAWNNNQDVLCYNCQSCKAGVVDSIKRDWRKVAFSDSLLLYLIFLATILTHCFWRFLVMESIPKNRDVERGSSLT